MADKTGIEWTDATWNPVTGCAKVSQGCKNCYALRDWPRMSANPKTVYFGREFTDVMCHPERLDQPRRWQKPRKIFVNSMSDLFHNDVPDQFIAQVFAVMALASQHVFQVLTKRPERMRDVVRKLPELASSVPEHLLPADGDIRPRDNVWLGVSVEDQDTADARVPVLLETPAAVRWISAEPLLGPVDLTRISPKVFAAKVNALSGNWKWEGGPTRRESQAIDWVVVGGESGPKARPMHPEWVRSLRDQCAAATVPFLFKQHGEWLATDFCDDDMAMIPSKKTVYIRTDGSFHDGSDGVNFFGGDQETAWVGKHAAGRKVDGMIHDGYPSINH